MEKYLDIISYIITGITIIVSLIATFLTSRKTKSRKCENEELTNAINEQQKEIESLELLNSSLTKMEQVVQDIPAIMEEAERTQMIGPAKRLYTLSQIMLKCCDLGVDYQKNASSLTNQVEKYIDFSKKVNAREDENNKEN